ncbi:chemotaxis protein CheW [Endozoicomonas sp. Mp262]|uniref:chemotaxis protein CheW n=1 Tax=Endozoicomonas sp. Mp262 TaxID=2919499 RepID=UPI0021D9331A
MEDPIPEKKPVPAPLTDNTVESSTAIESAYDYLPKSERARETLQKRAEALSVSDTGDEGTQDNNTVEYIRFLVGEDEQYGIPYPFLEEIIQAKQIFKVPCTPSYIAGVTNWRGTLITVLKLHPFFSAEPKESSDEKIIVVKNGGVTAGILADEIDVNDCYDPELLVPPLPSQSVTKLEYIKGIYLGRIAILDLALLLSDDSLYVK